MEIIVQPKQCRHTREKPRQDSETTQICTKGVVVKTRNSSRRTNDGLESGIRQKRCGVRSGWEQRGQMVMRRAGALLLVFPESLSEFEKSKLSKKRLVTTIAGNQVKGKLA